MSELPRQRFSSTSNSTELHIPPRSISRSISRRRVSDEGRITPTLTRASGAADPGHGEIYRPALLGAVAYGWLVESQIKDSVGRARHRRRSSVEDVRIDHRRADGVVAQQVLDGAAVAARCEQTR